MDKQCKVGRVATRRELHVPQYDSLDAALCARWKGEDGHAEHGYRTVTDWFNKRVLYTAYDRAGRETLGNRITADYETLQGDDELAKAELKEALRAAGINVDSLLEDMVSWGTMRSHLTDCLNEEKNQTESETDWELNTIAKAREVTAEKTENALSSLSNKGRIDSVETIAVDVGIQLRCTECPTVIPLEHALEQGYVCKTHRNQIEEVSR